MPISECPHSDQWGELFPKDEYGITYCPECKARRRGIEYRVEPEDDYPGPNPMPDDTAERLARYRKYLERNA